MRAGAILHYILERRAVVSRSGDIDELFSLSVRNVGSAGYSFVENDHWIWFGVTDSAAECIDVYDSAEPGGWDKEQKKLDFVVGKLPRGEISAGGERAFGARLFRHARVEVSDRESRFDDPLLLESTNHLNADRVSYRATVIFPEHHDGWDIVAPGASTITSRAATWESLHDGSALRHLRVTARAPTKNATALLYDDILAELDVMIGRDLFADAINLSELLCQVRLAEHPFVRELVAPLDSTDDLDGAARRSRLTRVRESMTKKRETFLRVFANFHHQAVITAPTSAASATPVDRIEAMTRNQLLDALCAINPPQLEILIAKLAVPPAYLPGVTAAPGSRIPEILRWADQQGRLADVARVLAEVTVPVVPLAPPPKPAPPPARRSARAEPPVDFLLITALEEERAALLNKLPGVRKLDRDGANAHTYYEASVATQRQDKAVYRILVTSLSGMGPIKGAIKAGAIIQRWNPGHVLMVGIAGGVDGEVAVGDVLAASQVADYTVGKVRERGSREERWMAYPADADLLDAAANFAAGWEDLLDHARPSAGAPKRHLGVVASGGDVVASKKQIDIYLADWPKLIGVEMEGGGVAAGLHDDIARPRFLMIRGVSDLANAEGNAEMKKLWRAYACHVAAAYTIGLLRDGPVQGRG